jgi:NAD(P)H-hydrate epimerase
VECDTGSAAPECIPAELTVTMAAVKIGLLKLPAFSLVGRLEVVGIGLAETDGDPAPDPPAWRAIQRQVIERAYARQALPPRPPDSHKGTFGTALVAAGSASYTGAALLAGRAAYRSGAGLVTLAVPELLHPILAGQFPEATWVLLPHSGGFIASDAAEILKQNLGRATALLLGPGFGLAQPTLEFLAHLLGSDQVGDASTRLPPMVVDADGLKLLAQLPDWAGLLPAPTVLTPHPGEMAILTGLTTAEIQADRLGAAEQFARLWGHVVVLKGAFTVIASPDGESGMIPVASSALARAGTGDVLAGLIAGLRAQGVGAFKAAAAGAWIHAQAGLQAAEHLGSTAAVLAGDVLEAVIPTLRIIAAL